MVCLLCTSLKTAAVPYTSGLAPSSIWPAFASRRLGYSVQASRLTRSPAPPGLPRGLPDLHPPLLSAALGLFVALLRHANCIWTGSTTAVPTKAPMDFVEPPLHIFIRSQAGLRGHRLGLPPLDQDDSGSLGSTRSCQCAQGF